MDSISGKTFKKKISNQTSLLIVSTLFVALYLVSNVMAVKVVCLFGFICFDAGTITFPFAYMLGDVLTEIWGYRTAKKVIWMTFFCNILMVLCTQVGSWLPSPEYLETTSQAYDKVFDYVPRIVLGSLVGFLLGELSNAWFMERIRQWTRGRYLWLRTIASSMIAYLFDSLPFVLIAFAGTLSPHDLWWMIAFQYLAKLLVEVFLGTPLAYAAIYGIKRYVEKK